MNTYNATSLNHWVGDLSWRDSMTWRVVESGRLACADTPLGSYSNEPQPDGVTFKLTFAGEAGVRTCPTKFTAINRVQGEADDHYRRLLAQRQQPARMKPPKW